jgi:hypothetical protein
MSYKGENLVLIADKTGEIGLINNSRLEEITKLEEIKEELYEGAGVEYEDQHYYKTMYGHGEVCLGLRRAGENHLLSWDTMNKVMVVPWPNVFNITSEMLQHKLDLKYCAVFGDKIASLSSNAKGE